MAKLRPEKVLPPLSGRPADALRSKEGAKIACGKSYFKTLSVGEDPARYHVARTVDDMMKAAGA